MTYKFKTIGRLCGALLLGTAFALPWQSAQAAHDIRGITQPADGFKLYTYPFYISLPDSSSLYMWGFGDLGSGGSATHAEGNGYFVPQYPAPTLIVKEGDAVSIQLTNYGVPDPVSIVVTGHQVTATGGSQGLVTRSSSNAGETVTYRFIAGEPGTYVYHSLDGANPGLHQEMGLAGALIVRPGDYDAATARSVYGQGTGSDYDQEFLYLLTEADPDIHNQTERGHVEHFTYSDRYATIWFVNGRVFPDLFQGNYNNLFPNQPYESLAQAHPGDKVLVRAVNVGQDSHPFHFHGENLRFVGRDGRMLSSDGFAADLGRTDNTLNSAPKQTVDMIWTWTGKDLNWDIYGPVSSTCTDSDNNMEDDNNLGVMCHDDNCNDGDADGFDDANHEYCADHGKALPVDLPGVGDLTLGGWWSGSPFLGDTGDLPPGEGGLNPFGGYFLVWHSHAEKELTTFNIFPGGSLSAVVVLPPYVEIQ